MTFFTKKYAFLTSVLIGAFCILLSGCVLSRENTYTYSTQYIFYDQYAVSVLSDPPGAKVEWNGENIGETPVVRVIDGRRSFYSGDILVKVYPAGSGQAAQSKVLRATEPLPREIHFDLQPEKP